MDKHRLEKEREKNRITQIEHQEREEMFKQERARKQGIKNRNIAIGVGILLLISGGIAYATLSPGNYDTFAQCLTEKGAKMYGEDWCQYTKAQKAMFGNSFKYIEYEQKQDLETRPTWVIEGQVYETVQSFQRLAALTGCKI